MDHLNANMEGEIVEGEIVEGEIVEGEIVEAMVAAGRVSRIWKLTLARKGSRIASRSWSRSTSSRMASMVKPRKRAQPQLAGA